MVSDVKTKMWFGKYKGQTIEALLKDNPSYLLWANRETKMFRLTDELVHMAVNNAGLSCEPTWKKSITRLGDVDYDEDPYRDTFGSSLEFEDLMM